MEQGIEARCRDRTDIRESPAYCRVLGLPSLSLVITMMRLPLGAFAFVLVLLSSACSTEQDARHRELAEMSQQHAQDLAEFQEAQAAFARRNPTPSQRDFPGEGTILLHEVSLGGRPDRAELWLRYTYVNTTDHPIDEAVVTIAIHDPTDSARDHAEEMRLRLPLQFRFSPDSSYTTYIAIPTQGAHLSPSWSWDIRPKASSTGPGPSRYR
jgi:hypothetical protein